MTDLEFIRWIPAHVARLNVQAAQTLDRDLVGDGAQVNQYSDPRFSWSAISRSENAVLGCGGISRFWSGRGMCWALVGAEIPRGSWLAITRFVRSQLDLAQAPGGYTRLEAHVAAAFWPGHKWMELLDFEIEAPCEAWGPDLSDFIQYKRIRRHDRR